MIRRDSVSMVILVCLDMRPVSPSPDSEVNPNDGNKWSLRGEGSISPYKRSENF
jgi:hypothetical protein